MRKIACILAILAASYFPPRPPVRDNLSKFVPLTDNYQYVYKVVCSGNPHVRNNLVLTGFRMQGWSGIVTALHGVVGATDIRATNAHSSLDNLQIYYVDIKNDLALLSSPGLSQSDDALSGPAGATLKSGDTLRIYGHPRGIQTYEQSGHVANPLYKILSSLIPGASSPSFDARQSPRDDIQVLNLNAQLLPGDSGAPVLDSADRVVGIVDGGLIGGSINWAIPTQNVVWKDAREMTAALRRLASLDPGDLFALETGESSEAGSQSGDVYTYQMTGIIGGYPVTTGDFNETHRLLGRFGKDRSFNLTIKEMKNGRLCDIAILKSPQQNNRLGETYDEAGTVREHFLAGINFLPLTKRTADAELYLNPGWRCTR